MQLSLINEAPELDKKFFLDVFAMGILDVRRGSIRLETITGQPVPGELRVSCPNRFLQHHPEGTIFKLDARLVRREGCKPYFISINRKNIRPAIEFFEYNLKVRNGFDYIPPTKR